MGEKKDEWNRAKHCMKGGQTRSDFLTTTEDTKKMSMINTATKELKIIK